MRNTAKFWPLLLAAIFSCLFFAAGCSTDENPITPDKMKEIRQKEAEERANFTPPGTDKPKGQ